MWCKFVFGSYILCIALSCFLLAIIFTVSSRSINQQDLMKLMPAAISSVPKHVTIIGAGVSGAPFEVIFILSLRSNFVL